MRGLESRLHRLENRIMHLPFITLEIPFECTEDDKQYLLQKHLREGGNPSAPVIFITNYSPEFKEQFAKNKERITL